MSGDSVQLENGGPPLANGSAGKKSLSGGASAADTSPPSSATKAGTGNRTTPGTSPVSAAKQESVGIDGNSNGEGGDSLHRVCLEAQRKVAAFLAEKPETELLRAVQGQVRVALAVIDKALEDYRPSQLSISYNGGKDCLVMLILILACLPRHFAAPSATAFPPTANGSAEASSSPTPSSSSTTKSGEQPQLPTEERLKNGHARPAEPFPTSLQAIYVVSKHPFAEVDAFVDQTSAAYHLSVERIAQSMRPALHAYLTSRPAVRAVFVGTRRTDPHGESLTHFDPTDPGWPPFMRVHPVIDWHYVEIWAFIRHLGIPYCELYDRGYTSLGGTTDTSPNPALKRRGGAAEGGRETFRPAYELVEDYEERLGRDS